MDKITLSLIRNLTLAIGKHKRRGTAALSIPLCLFFLIPPEAALSQTTAPDPEPAAEPAPAVEPASTTTGAGVRVVVNSNADGPAQADNQLTLREAIAIVNGSLSVDRLSQEEKAQVTTSSTGSRIEFNLPQGSNVIQLVSQLPDLDSPGLVVDGTTQPGYDANTSATAEIAIPVPVVSITPAANTSILRGLTVVADNTTIRGLSVYGFSPRLGPLYRSGSNDLKSGSVLGVNALPEGSTLTTPPADIFIAHRQPPPDIRGQQPPNSNFPFGAKDVPPKGVVLENNWLGITPDEKVPETRSAFGVYVFNSTGTTIRRNRISNQDGSAIITSVRAENLNITENILVANGLAGMADGIRLEGAVNGGQINGNLICGNDGAGIYMFKPEGQVNIQNNRITYNGRRLRRAAVYLMGNDHQITGNEIRNQTGPGVVVTSFPNGGYYGNGAAKRNIIRNNKFSSLEGLSIDLNTQQNLDVSDFQVGDGANPKRNSNNRRLETGNAAINAPRFVASVLPVSGGSVQVIGTADPGSEVDIYRVQGNVRGLIRRQQDQNAINVHNHDFGPLSEPLGTVTTDAEGNFTTNLTGLQQGDRISAIASDPKYGTSEPAVNAFVGAATGTPSTVEPTPTRPTAPQCVSRPAPPAPPPEPAPPEPEPPPQTLRIRIPRNVHFAFDKSNISPATAQVLDRVVEVLQQYPTILVEVEGHTDPRGSDAYNQALGRRRALAVRNYLLQRGIAAERMTIRSSGERQLLTPDRSRVGHARNRRVEMLFREIRGVEIIIEAQEEDLQPDR